MCGGGPLPGKPVTSTSAKTPPVSLPISLNVTSSLFDIQTDLPPSGGMCLTLTVNDLLPRFFRDDTSSQEVLGSMPVPEVRRGQDYRPGPRGLRCTHRRGSVVGMKGCEGKAQDRKSTRLNSSHANISYAVFCLKKKQKKNIHSDHKIIASDHSILLHLCPSHSIP